ncbi:MAG: thiamine-phosphate kinase [Burkholderiales bacterium]|nr:thiamine-phosphate kinase [Burkholderiales bacterium]MBK8667198.1 thiamine-phosphate kinase [Burkholderiales bacterium]
MGEFELIDRFFKRRTPASGAVALGIGDDCALLRPAPGMQIAISTDMLVEGRHFLPDVDPEHLGHKALAVNLSDLAAMGAEPLGCTLALALPPERARDAGWLTALARGLFALADAHACPLIGGDTTAGPLNLCLTVFGQVPAGQALRRDGAQAGDHIWVSGTLGHARLALGALRGEWTLPPAVLAAARQRLERPTPRLALGRALRGIAHSAIDVSDGLLGDLGHILKASGTGASIDAAAASRLLAAGAALDAETLRTAALAGGDDYELVFTAPPAARAAVLRAGHASATPVSRIGTITAGTGLRLLGADGQPLRQTYASFDHFARS